LAGFSRTEYRSIVQLRYDDIHNHDQGKTPLEERRGKEGVKKGEKNKKERRET
jgi:hypothetical protein